MKDMFDANGITHDNVSKLLKNWFSFGLTNTLGLQCKTCLKEPAPRSRDTRLTLISMLEFPEVQHPPHLYFNVEVGKLSGLSAKQDFMGSIAWPFVLKVWSKKYILQSRGYWEGVHYWTKVLRNSARVLGLGMHNDWENNGYATLLSPKLSDIGGADPSTSWVFYLRAWTEEEKEYVDEKIVQVQKEHPNAPGQVPFIKLKQILTSRPLKQVEVKQKEIADCQSSQLPELDQVPAAPTALAPLEAPARLESAPSMHQNKEPQAVKAASPNVDAHSFGEGRPTRRSARNPTTIKITKKKS
jgi:hypothetical protein